MGERHPSAGRPLRSLAHRFARRLPRTIRGRLALTYVALILVVMTGLGFYLRAVAADLYLDRLTDQLATQARLVAEFVGPNIAAGSTIEQIDPIAKRLGQRIAARVTIIGPDGTVLGESTRDPLGIENDGGRPEVVAARRQGLGIATRPSTTTGESYLYVAVPVPPDNAAVARVAMPLDQVDAAVARVQRDLAIATVIAAILVAAVGVGVGGRIARPLDDLRRQVLAVSAGQFDATVEPAATRELGDLGHAFNDMTRRLNASLSELDQTRARLEAMLASLTDGVVITDVRGGIIRLNAAARRMLGHRDLVSGQPFVQVARDHELATLLRQALAGPTGVSRAVTVEHGRSGLILQATAQRLAGVGEELGLVVLRDLTELRRLEGVRREFVANVSHELRTPLASIKALVETLEVGAIDDPLVAHDFLARIIGEVDRLAALVDELLDLARLESGRVSLRIETIDSVALIRAGLDRLRPQIERAHLTLLEQIPSALPSVRADRARIEQVLLNLVHNAIKFTPAGGTITVSGVTTDGSVRVAVHDTGIGVPPEELPRLFERFYKTDKARHSKGTGLGLAIAKHIVQAHGGAIWAESTPGEGATFSFTLRVAEADRTGSVEADPNLVA